MMNISKRSEYGLMFLTFLAEKQNSLTSIRVAARDLKIPYRFLSRIASDLKRAKLIGSKEGVTGGYFVEKKPQAISLAKLIQVLDGPLGLVKCQRTSCPKSNKCSYQKVWNQLKNEIETELNKFSVANFLHYK